MTSTTAFAVSAPLSSTASSFRTPLASPRRSHRPRRTHITLPLMVETTPTPKVSPVPTKSTDADTASFLELTAANVDLVLDEMRPYLMSDGGNVSVADIDGATVKLQLEGACGSCPSSTMTMKMGLERRLRERIPEIEEVVQVEPEGAQLTPEGIESTLDEVRPFLNVAGGSIELIELLSESAVPTARLRMTGSGAAINSVKVEITHRLKRNWTKLANVTFES